MDTNAILQVNSIDTLHTQSSAPFAPFQLVGIETTHRATLKALC